MSLTPQQLLQSLGIQTEGHRSHVEYLADWQKVQELAKALTGIELTMRKALFAATFPVPKEGSNTFNLSDGRKLVAQHKLTRGIDEALIAPTRAEYELVNDRPVPFDELLKTSYALVTSAYRKLEPAPGSAPSQAYTVISRMVTTKPATPSLEVK